MSTIDTTQLDAQLKTLEQRIDALQTQLGQLQTPPAKTMHLRLTDGWGDSLCLDDDGEDIYIYVNTDKEESDRVEFDREKIKELIVWLQAR